MKVLDIFKGKLTYQEVNELPLNELYLLMDAEKDLIIEKEKQQKKMQEDAEKEQRKSVSKKPTIFNAPRRPKN